MSDDGGDSWQDELAGNYKMNVGRYDHSAVILTPDICT